MTRAKTSESIGNVSFGSLSAVKGTLLPNTSEADSIYECVEVVDISYEAFWAGTKGSVFTGVGRLHPGERIGLYPPNHFFVGIERNGVSAVPDPNIQFEQKWVPEAIRAEADVSGKKRFDGVILHIARKQLEERFKLIQGESPWSAAQPAK